MNKKFKILSIDGGGIRGIYPAYYLTLIEQELSKRQDGKTKIKDHFHLITGTSTGGIIAIALSLGIPANKIYKLYFDNAKKIFGNKRGFWSQLLKSAHKSDDLESLVRKTLSEQFNGEDPRMNDCQTGVAIPIYDLIKGAPSVIKSPYHPNFKRDLHIPAYKVAMATSAAPTYFDPYSTEYVDLDGINKPFKNKIDGGVVANNPTMIGVMEALKAFNVELTDLEILSIGTGYKTFKEGESKRTNWGLNYWIRKDGRKRLIELFMQSQSQLVENHISLYCYGIDKINKKNPNFIYNRVNVSLCEDDYIEMDESDSERIKNFSELAMAEFHENGREILETHFY